MLFFSNFKRKAERKKLLQEAEVVMKENMIKNNSDVRMKYMGDQEYGLVPNKPIYCQMAHGAKKYISSLRTIDGQPLIWDGNRTVYGIDGINGAVDGYELKLETGELYSTIYINIYSLTNSPAIPKGFTQVKYDMPSLLMKDQ